MKGILFWGIPAVALACYCLLMLIFVVSKKDRTIRAFLPFLAALIGWTATSLLMKSAAVPGPTFWNRVMVSCMLAVPGMFCRFVWRFTDRGTRTAQLFWLAGMLAVVALNLCGAFVGEVTLTVQGSLPAVNYDLRWPVLFVVPFIGMMVIRTISDLSAAVRQGKVARQQAGPIIGGMVLMFFGCLCNVIPVLGRYPIDILASLLNAILLMTAIYKYRLFELRFLLTRGLTYAILTTVLAGLAVWSGTAAERALMERFPEAAPFRTVIFALALTMALQVIYGLCRAVVDRVFVNNEYVRRQALRNFSVTVSNKLDLSVILKELAGAVRESIQTQKVYVLLRDEKSEQYAAVDTGEKLERPDLVFADSHPIVGWLSANDACLSRREIAAQPCFRSMWESERRQLREFDVELLIPLRCRETLTGMVLLGPKENGGEYTAEDTDVLLSMGASAAIAIDNARLYDQARAEAKTDELTGLANRRQFYDLLNQYIGRGDGGCVSLLVLDLDLFKLYNDLYGHYEGDRALQRVAHCLSLAVGGAGTAFRNSGQEFAVLLPWCDGRQAMELAERIRQEVQRIFSESGPGRKNGAEGCHFLTVSIGVCVYPHAAHNADELVKRADMALYSAKSKGKNRVEIYSVRQQAELSVQGADENEYAATLYALAAAIDAKDHFTFSHSQKVADYTAALANAMGMDEMHVSMIREAALLHDVGKIGVPEHILTKPGRLTEEEYKIIQRHVETSIAIIKYLPSLNYIIPTVLGHHERWDGKGYPRGIAGENIPIGARCLCVADSFDAMTSARPYKEPLSVEYALAEIEREAGQQFDPTLAKKFVELVRSGVIEVQSAGR